MLREVQISVSSVSKTQDFLFVGQGESWNCLKNGFLKLIHLTVGLGQRLTFRPLSMTYLE